MTADSLPLVALPTILRTLADPTRWQIYQVLREGEACVCEIASRLGIAENLVSHHLRALRTVNLVVHRSDDRDARWVYYRLNLETLGVIASHMGLLFDPATVGTRTPTCGPAAQMIPPPRRTTHATRS